MLIKKCWKSLACLLCLLVVGIFASGCATTSQLQELEAKIDKAMQQSQSATDMAKDVESKCAEYKTDATEDYKAVQKAADRAEAAADRAESAADRAEAAADKTKEMYDKIMAK